MAIKKPIIFDGYAGDGLMWARAWEKTEHYLGCEKKPVSLRDRRRLVVADNVRLLRHRAFAVDDFDIYDLDAYNHPFHQLMIVLRRLSRPCRKGFALTIAFGVNMRISELPRSLLKTLGLTFQVSSGMLIFRERKKIIELMIRRACAGWKVEAVAWESGSSGAVVDYIGLIVSG